MRLADWTYMYSVDQKTVPCSFTVVSMFTDFYIIWHRVYWDNVGLQHAMLLHYLGNLFLVSSVSNVDFSGNIWVAVKRGVFWC